SAVRCIRVLARAMYPVSMANATIPTRAVSRTANRIRTFPGRRGWARPPGWGTGRWAVFHMGELVLGPRGGRSVTPPVGAPARGPPGPPGEGGTRGSARRNRPGLLQESEERSAETRTAAVSSPRADSRPGFRPGWNRRPRRGGYGMTSFGGMVTPFTAVGSAPGTIGETLLVTTNAGCTHTFFGLLVKSTLVTTTPAYPTRWYWAVFPLPVTVSYSGMIRGRPMIASNEVFTDVLSPVSPVAVNGTYSAPSGATLLAKSLFWKSAVVGPYRICRFSSVVPLSELPMSSDPKFPGPLSRSPN